MRSRSTSYSYVPQRHSKNKNKNLKKERKFSGWQITQILEDDQANSISPDILLTRWHPGQTKMQPFIGH